LRQKTPSRSRNHPRCTGQAGRFCLGAKAAGDSSPVAHSTAAGPARRTSKRPLCPTHYPLLSRGRRVQGEQIKPAWVHPAHWRGCKEALQQALPCFFLASIPVPRSIVLPSPSFPISTAAPVQQRRQASLPLPACPLP
jgi:hypothetical protein